jgi:hypothetical protein
VTVVATAKAERPAGLTVNLRSGVARAAAGAVFAGPQRAPHPRAPGLITSP